MYACYNCSGEPRNTYLLETQIPIANTGKCKQLYEKNNIVIDSRIVICAGGKKRCLSSNFLFYLYM